MQFKVIATALLFLVAQTMARATPSPQLQPQPAKRDSSCTYYVSSTFAMR